MIETPITKQDITDITKLVKEGLSGSKIAKQLHIRKADVLNTVRQIKGIPKRKATVKGKGSQTRARRKAKTRQQKNNDKSIKRIKTQFQHPKSRFYAIITTKRKFVYPSKSENKTNTIYMIVSDKTELDRARDKRIDLYDEGLAPIMSFVDIQNNRKVSERYVEKRISGQ